MTRLELVRQPLDRGGRGRAFSARVRKATIGRQHVDRNTLTIHADDCSSMASKLVAFFRADLGVTKTHSRPHMSDEDPFVRVAIPDV